MKYNIGGVNSRGRLISRWCNEENKAIDKSKTVNWKKS